MDSSSSLTLFRREQEFTPEQKLWARVLIRAYKDILRSDEKEDALQWFHKKDTGLDEICTSIGIDATCARERSIFIARNAHSIKLRNMFDKFDADICG